jgi:Tetratricopeptide repeat.
MNSKKLYREMGVLLVVVIGAGFIIPPRIAVVYNNRGARLYQLGELPAAVAAYKISLRWQSASVVHYNLACVYEKLGSIREAITEFALAVKLDPRYSDAVEALIDLSRRSGDLPQAEAYLREFQQAGGTALDRYAGILRKDRERQLLAWCGAKL